MALRLVFPKKVHEEDCRRFVEEHEPIDTFLMGASGLETMPFDAWLKKVHDMQEAQNLPEGYVCASVFLAYDNERLVGIVNIRHHLNEKLRKTAGHIGFIVRKSLRGKGYGKLLLEAALRFARKNLGLERVLLSCAKTNLPSKRTIQALGGVYEKSAFARDLGEFAQYWIDLGKQDGK